MRDLVKRNLEGRKVLLLFLLTSLIYTIMLTITIPRVMSYSGGMKLLDMMPTGYNAAYIDSLFNNLGEKGRNAYLFRQIPVDMIFPALFGISYCLIFAYFLKKLGKADSYLFYFSFLPLLAGLFDYLENIGIIAMLQSYPNISMTLSQSTNVFSVLKSSFTTIYFLLLIILLIAFGANKIFKKNRIQDRS